LVWFKLTGFTDPNTNVLLAMQLIVFYNLLTGRLACEKVNPDSAAGGPKQGQMIIIYNLAS
jgi:hypothetical protein